MHKPYTTRTHAMHRDDSIGLVGWSMILTLMGAAVFAATPLAAQTTPDTFSLPAGCTAYLTVQSADCSVDHQFVCEGEPAGHKSRVSLSQAGMTYLGTVDDETQWITSFHAISGHTEALDANPADPASLTELIANGIDTFDFTTTSPEVGTTRYVGQDTLTGRIITIDDVALDETQYDIIAYDDDGSVMWSATGNEFISREWRFFLSGTSTITTPTDSFDTDGRPVEFIFPGEPGFLSSNPKHGCGVEMSSFAVTP